MNDIDNLADYLSQHNNKNPKKIAVSVPKRCISIRGVRTTYKDYSYRELYQASAFLAQGFLHIGLKKGTRVALMVKPGFEFFSVTFALFRIGVIPVLIDPGIGIKNMGKCLKKANIEGFIGIPTAHIARLLFRWSTPSLCYRITLGQWCLPGWHSLKRISLLGQRSNRAYPSLSIDDKAAILFTSGSTGAPKGVQYHMRHFLAQIALLKKTYQITPGEIDLPTFPLFALFDVAMGMTTVVPVMNPSRPAKANPVIITETIDRFGVTNLFGSPALLNSLGRYLEKNPSVQLPSLKRILCAGEVLPASTMIRLLGALSDTALIYTAYGATECLPVASADHPLLLKKEIQKLTESGAGICVGQVVEGNEVRIIEITDDSINNWCDVTTLPTGKIGEIVVYGPSTTQSYYDLTQATQLAKIKQDEKPWQWHRMGDVGYLDNQNRLWFCGRKAHRVVVEGTDYFTVPIEAIFNSHPGVFRSALVGVKKENKTVLVLCVELESSASDNLWKQFVTQFKTLAMKFTVTKDIKKFLLHDQFPVDIRHNAKIRREELAIWAQEQI